MKKINSLTRDFMLIAEKAVSYFAFIITVLSLGVTITKYEIKLETPCLLIVYALLFVIALFIAGIKYFLKRENTVYEKGSKSINIIYGDLFEIAFQKDGNKGIVVVPVNTAFDTIVDEKISNVDKPLVSPKTLHGQWITKMLGYGFTMEELDERINRDLSERHICPIQVLTREQKKRGNTKCFERGTVSVVEHKYTTFFLFAMSVFDANNNAQCSRDEFIEAMQKLLLFCDNNSNGKDIYIPLMGTNLSRANMNHEESLQSLVALCKLYEAKIHNKVYIVVYEGDRDKVSIYDAK